MPAAPKNRTSNARNKQQSVLSWNLHFLQNAYTMHTVCRGNTCAKENMKQERRKNDSKVSVLNREAREGLTVSVLFE